MALAIRPKTPPRKIGLIVSQGERHDPASRFVRIVHRRRSGAKSFIGMTTNPNRKTQMKKSIITAAMILALASTGAFAKAMTGTIKSVDKNGDAITLSDGTTFTLPEGIEAETLKVGEKVIVTYSTTAAGKLAVSSIHPAK
jgi:hypothetical protein